MSVEGRVLWAQSMSQVSSTSCVPCRPLLLVVVGVAVTQGNGPGGRQITLADDPSVGTLQQLPGSVVDDLVVIAGSRIGAVEAKAEHKRHGLVGLHRRSILILGFPTDDRLASS